MDNISQRLIDINAVPLPYRKIFSDYPCFNLVQSEILNDVLYTDNSLVVSAPTGSGKTAIFELAIVNLLMQTKHLDEKYFKIIYVCPMKSLCQERLLDWYRKFSEFGLSCTAVTGDSENIDFNNLNLHDIIITTPEKWDSLTRKWTANHKEIAKMVRLFMIDEIHLLNEDYRGSTLEVIVCRMKSVGNCRFSFTGGKNHGIRFIAVSASIPNAKDIGEWIDDQKTNVYQFPEDIRPVPLQKIILGYPYNPKKMSVFKFDLSLNYKLRSLIIQHSEGKPTLIFCSTRKSVEMTAANLVTSLQIFLTPEQKQHLEIVSSHIPDKKVKESIKYGIGYHHAGLIPETRHIIEEVFRNSHLPVLVTTSTLAMGVNLPAHLVIIKSTKTFINCEFRDYNEIAIQQMIGRAGRPQFDNSATAIILTTEQDKPKFEKIIKCENPIESNLHRHLTENLNAEIVLRTITGLDDAMHWLASTFLYVRARKSPHHYGLNVNLTEEEIDRKLLEVCKIDLNKLVKSGMITIDQHIAILPTQIGQIMANYYVAFETMKLFTQLSGKEILMQILSLVSKCQEFADLRLRVNEKKTLNALNSKSNGIRFPLNGRIKNESMKVNCIIQAVFGNFEIQDHSLLSDSMTIIRNGKRIVKCLIQYLQTKKTNCFNALKNAVILGKCFHAKLWENSEFVSKQFSGIGSVLSAQLVNAGKTNFERISMSNPRDIEVILKKKPPFGDFLIEEVKYLPRYSMNLQIIQQDRNYEKIKLTISLTNPEDLKIKSTINLESAMVLLVGNDRNEILLHEKIRLDFLMEKTNVVKYMEIKKHSKNVQIEAFFISEDWVGIDCSCKLLLLAEHEENLETTNGETEESDYMNIFLDMYKKLKPIKKNNAKKQKGTVLKTPVKKRPLSQKNTILTSLGKMKQIENKYLKENYNEVENLCTDEIDFHVPTEKDTSSAVKQRTIITTQGVEESHADIHSNSAHDISDILVTSTSQEISFSPLSSSLIIDNGIKEANNSYFEKPAEINDTILESQEMFPCEDEKEVTENVTKNDEKININWEKVMKNIPSTKFIHSKYSTKSVPQYPQLNNTNTNEDKLSTTRNMETHRESAIEPIKKNNAKKQKGTVLKTPAKKRPYTQKNTIITSLGKMKQIENKYLKENDNEDKKLCIAEANFHVPTKKDTSSAVKQRTIITPQGVEKSHADIHSNVAHNISDILVTSTSQKISFSPLLSSMIIDNGIKEANNSYFEKPAEINDTMLESQEMFPCEDENEVTENVTKNYEKNNIYWEKVMNNIPSTKFIHSKYSTKSVTQYPQLNNTNTNEDKMSTTRNMETQRESAIEDQDYFFSNFEINKKKIFRNDDGSHIDTGESSSIRNGLLCMENEILEPLSKSGTIHSDICDLSDRKPNQKTLTWRSPLVFSPNVRFSPQNVANPVNSRDRNERKFQNEILNKSVEITSLKNSQDLTLKIHKTSENTISSSNPLNKKTNGGSQFVLADKDNFEDTLNLRENKQDVNKNERSLLDGFKMNKNKHQPDDHTLHSSVMEYYSHFSPKHWEMSEQRELKHNILKSEQCSKIARPTRYNDHIPQAFVASQCSPQHSRNTKELQYNVSSDHDLPLEHEPLSQQNSASSKYSSFTPSQMSMQYRSLTHERNDHIFNRHSKYENDEQCFKINSIVPIHTPERCHHDFYKPTSHTPRYCPNETMVQNKCKFRCNYSRTIQPVKYGLNMLNPVESINQTKHYTTTSEDQLFRQQRFVNQIANSSMPEASTSFYETDRTSQCKNYYTQQNTKISSSNEIRTLIHPTGLNRRSQINITNSGKENSQFFTTGNFQKVSSQDQFSTHNTAPSYNELKKPFSFINESQWGVRAHIPRSSNFYIDNRSPYFQQTNSAGYLHNRYIQSSHHPDSTPLFCYANQPPYIQTNDKECAMRRFSDSCNQNI